MNPVKSLRRKTGLSCLAFAVLYGCKNQTLARTESGHPDRIPAAVLTAFLNAGVDPAGLEEEYQEWRRQKATAEQENRAA